jgi:hypothetical protein
LTAIPLAELLRSDHPQSLRQFARLVGDEHYLGWADLLHSVRSGAGAFRHRYGMSLFEWYQQNPRRGAIFDGAMGDHSRAQIEALLAAYDFSGITHLVDVGGGQGLWGQAGAAGRRLFRRSACWRRCLPAQAHHSRLG